MLLIFLRSPKTSFIHRLPGALNLALMDRRSRSGSAHREYEREWGNPGTRRSIRGGKSARRKGEAYIRYQEAQGVEQIPVARPGGQQRPLGTSRHWSPSGSEAGDDQGDLGYQEPSLVDPVPLVLAPQSRLYRPRGAPEVPEPRAFPKRNHRLGLLGHHRLLRHLHPLELRHRHLLVLKFLCLLNLEELKCYHPLLVQCPSHLYLEGLKLRNQS